MLRNLVILALAAAVVALPFLLRREEPRGAWRPGDPEVVVITPMNEAIRYEFGRAFSEWHSRHFGKPARVDWRAVGGSTEIVRYLDAQYVASFRAWWLSQGKEWPSGGGEMILDKRFDAAKPPALNRRKDETDAHFAMRQQQARRRWEQQRELHTAFRSIDDSRSFGSRIDLLFGAGEYDHTDAFLKGMTVPPWPPDQPPENIFAVGDTVLIPEKVSGETWRTSTLFGCALSAFGICYNIDRLADLGIPVPPAQWADLADPRYFQQIAAADPTKSGSISKAFEMIVQQKCRQAVEAAGFSGDEIEQFEAAFQAGAPAGELPPAVPQAYQTAVEEGWEEGLRLIQLIGANARYFTDSASKVLIDVSMGNAAAGLAIDFYGRSQAQASIAPGGRECMRYITPVGGSSISCDPVSLLRGAENREVAIRLITFMLSEDGQRLWSYKPGAPGGPHRFPLMRLPIRRDFYPCEDEALKEASRKHARHAFEPLDDPAVNPYSLADNFTYRSRWTASHFGVQRDLIKAMCLDSGEELRAAWLAILTNGGPENNPQAMQLLGRLPTTPERVTWRTAPGMMKRHGKLNCIREWTAHFRRQYREVIEMTNRTENE